MILPEIEKFHLHKDEPNKLQFEIMSLREMMISTHPHNTIPHVHSFYQIIWFQKGSGVHYVDFNAYPVQPNTLYLISKGQIHNFDDNIYEGYIIHFNESFISNSDNFVNLFLNQNLFHSFEKEPYFRFESNNIGRAHV